ncbi:hypothetical protein A9G25_08185 [Gilliamella sp. Bif1-4]|nr:hypothetical protein A9G25_08185 [Gilliamella apicola]
MFFGTLYFDLRILTPKILHGALCNDRKQKFNRFINTAKTHKVISGKMPYEFLGDYFNNEV